ncbi:YgaP family membrane protein [Porticoccus sp.]
MKANVGTIDRVIRVVLGLVLIALVFVGPQTPWGWVGVIPLVTGLISNCPLYSILGLSTCPIKKH